MGFCLCRNAAILLVIPLGYIVYFLASSPFVVTVTIKPKEGRQEASAPAIAIVPQASTNHSSHHPPTETTVMKMTGETDPAIALRGQAATTSNSPDKSIDITKLHPPSTAQATAGNPAKMIHDQASEEEVHLADNGDMSKKKQPTEPKLVTSAVPTTKTHNMSNKANPTKVVVANAEDPIQAPGKLMNNQKSPKTTKDKLTTPSQANPKTGRPIIFIGTHHKTGTVLAKHVFKKIAQVSGLRLNTVGVLKRGEHWAQLGRSNIVVLDHWNLTRADLEELGRPYKFVHFVRDPIAIAISAYLYHLKGTEKWLFNEKNATRPDWCSGKGADAKTPMWCNRYGKDAPALCQKKAMAINSLICHEYDLLEKEESRRESSWKISHFDALKKRSRLDGVRLEAARSYSQLLTMAITMKTTQDDPNSMTVNLDSIVSNYSVCWRQILSFLGLEEYQGLTSQFDIAQQNTGSHFTRNENKDDLKQELNDPLVQEAYRVLYNIIGEQDLTCH